MQRRFSVLMQTVAPLAFFHFRVRLYHRGRFFRAYLLDLNESGALFGLGPENYMQVDVSGNVRGSIDSRHGTEIDFTGLVAEKRGQQIKGQFFHTVQVRFDTAVNLSDRLLATTISLLD